MRWPIVEFQCLEIINYESVSFDGKNQIII